MCIVSLQFTFRQLASLGQDSYLFKLPTNVQLDFFNQIADAKTLAAPKIRGQATDPVVYD